ncbi:hypothetical protein N7493_007776 [Penicillium malachiteum]|uniref:Uncharacterized protein n=1 Tax=Penicillium malachiteum TaxID=1324776 RepID=A0AAD6MUG1_9EURO|nr:hypothetical protein N7493_007776 [Penicillium malachiteum]
MGFWELIEYIHPYVTILNILSVYIENWHLKRRVRKLEADLHEHQAACWCQRNIPREIGIYKNKRS